METVEQSVTHVADPDAERLRVLLSQLDNVDEEVRRRRRTRGMEYFTPNSPQLAACKNQAKELAFVGGNRSSKSTCGAFILASHLTRNYRSCECHGEWFHPAKRFYRPIKAVVVVTEYPILDRVIEQRIMEQIPADWIKRRQRSSQGHLVSLHGKDGGRLDCLTNEMADMAFESADWDFAWFDEPTQKNKYYAIRRGLLDREGHAILTFTPLIEPWMKEDIIDKADGIHRDVIQASTYDNTEDIHGNPILKRSAIKAFEADLPADLAKTRVYGQFFHMRGIVWQDYTPSIHERIWQYQYPDPVIGVLDPHTRKPHWMIWAFLNRLDQLCIDRELIMPGTIQDLSRSILQHEARAGYKVVMRLCDPNFGRTPNLITGRSVIEELARPPFPVSFGEADDHKETGILKVKELLHFRKDIPIGATNTPRLFFHRGQVPNTIRSVRNFQYDEWRGQTKHDKDLKEKEKQKDTDGADCVRYLSMANLTFDSIRASQSVANAELEEAPY